MQEPWNEGHAGLAEWLIQDVKHRAEVEGIDSRQLFAHWDNERLVVSFKTPEGRDTSGCKIRGYIVRWRPKRDPIVLTGRIQPCATRNSRHVTIILPEDCDKDTEFEITLKEVVR